jgi:hypothetical protein
MSAMSNPFGRITMSEAIKMAVRECGEAATPARRLLSEQVRELGDVGGDAPGLARSGSSSKWTVRAGALAGRP